MSVPPSRLFASVLRQKFGATDDAVRMLPATLSDTVPPEGYAFVEIGGEEYRVPSMFGTVNRTPHGDVANAGALVWLLTTPDRIVATPGPTGDRAPRTFPEIEGIWDLKEDVHPAVEGDVFLDADGDVWYHVGPDDPPPEWRFCFKYGGAAGALSYLRGETEPDELQEFPAGSGTIIVKFHSIYNKDTEVFDVTPNAPGDPTSAPIVLLKKNGVYTVTYRLYFDDTPAEGDSIEVTIYEPDYDGWIYWPTRKFFTYDAIAFDSITFATNVDEWTGNPISGIPPGQPIFVGVETGGATIDYTMGGYVSTGRQGTELDVIYHGEVDVSDLVPRSAPPARGRSRRPVPDFVRMARGD